MLDKYTQQLSKINLLKKLETFISKIPEYEKKETSILNEKIKFHEEELKKLKSQQRSSLQIGKSLKAAAKEKALSLLSLQ